MTTPASPLAAPYPRAARIAALAGLLWSLFGAWQFVRQTFTDEAGLIAGGMTPEQAQLYAALPVWMAAVFAIGTLGGVLGAVLLLAQRRASIAVLAVSLAAYLALWAGDALLGVFAVFGTPQVVVLSIVVLVAAGLLWLAQRLAAKGMLV
ncbi:MAG: hypothetical protein NBV68_11545 [Erythrobacter sp.]|uniref:hypothetical protein n=1 Tax=Erythrobacter sp. TaxID=1042 RepID=UPI0025EBE340|nr:hypothetical protein [Erythrobacter sp.]MCM0000008.1 hypothetical protein [Erythrobacter sp.]